jgi:hypothetical protein
VKGPSGCAVRQNSKSDLVQGLIVLELEEGLIASLTLGLLYRRRSNRQAAAMMTFSDRDPASAAIKIQAKPSTRKQSPRSKLDEQRLLVYKNGLDPWYSAELNQPLPTGGQAVAQALCDLSLGIWKWCLRRVGW